MTRVVFLIAMAACAQPQPSTQPPAVDAATLVGSWRYLPFDPARTPPDQREVLELADDGTYAIRNRRGTQTGAYELDGNYLTLGAGTSAWIVTGVAATAERLLVDAVFPTSAPGRGGLAGTYAGEQSSAQATTDIELDLRADGTARVRQTGTLVADDEATWVEDGDFAVLTFSNPTRNKAFGTLPGLAIGEWMYERLP
ncbi:MAG: hypothetical protein KF773_43075 [Deltaproteobacteria bacterium]|nr:hypothetical protein [Deltaproteobacteria bacterium]